VKILIVSGIWPPDVGGPASHGPELGAHLVARGHDVRAVTSRGEAAPELPDFPLTAVRRDRSRVVRQAAGAAAVARAAADVDAVYTTGMYTRSALAVTAARRPLVMKLASDPAYERARRSGLFEGTVEEFQEADGPAIRGLKRVRSAAVGRADRVFTPSRFLGAIVDTWGVTNGNLSVIPNPAPPVTNGIARGDLRRRLGMAGPTFVFAGRLVPQKNVSFAVAAVAELPSARLVVVGSGEDRDAIDAAVERHGVGDRVHMAGPMSRAQGMEWVRAADAAVLPSDYENFPHAAVEALAVGTPVIGTSVGGVPEIVTDGENGFLVPRRDSGALADAMARIAGDQSLRDRLSRGAVASATRFTTESAFGAIEHEIEVASRSR
jgi:glycosyltransferase involved in cell wall biosynthesis